MVIDTNTMVSMTEANQNFSKVARLVDEKGSAVIMKNNMPKYLVIDFNKVNEEFFISEETMFHFLQRLMKYKDSLDMSEHMQKKGGI